jgi:succinate-semialdehyde dehydrogenase/glutarate-semialdehyde dehydrogenase
MTAKKPEAKIATADKCFRAWRNTTYAERATIVDMRAESLNEKAGAFAHTMTL